MFNVIKLTDADMPFLEKNGALSIFVTPFIKIGDYYFANNKVNNADEQKIRISSVLRPMLKEDQKYPVIGVVSLPPADISRIQASIRVPSLKTCSSADVEKALETLLPNRPLYVGQKYAFKLKDIANPLTCEIRGLYRSDEKEQEIPVHEGVSMPTDLLTISIEGDGVIEPEHCRLRKAFDPSKWDFKSIQIGGLNEELFTILRRAFLSRLMKPSLRQKLKVQHVKGMLLYGPPGTGKTLIARKIGLMLGLKENDDRVRIINGPELFSKWSGEAENRLRELFKTKTNDLHILIFDEIESSAKKRDSGSNSDISGKFVTQFLALLDGVKQQDNIFVIGMTNRKDLIDPAMLRPGRLEIHVEISLPDENGRKEILAIHTASIRDSNMLSDSVDLDTLAKQTKNFTGAELEALVKSAVSFATTKTADISQADKIMVELEDFQLALKEIFPAFGSVYEDMSKYMRYGLLPLPDLDPNLLVEYVNKLPANIYEKILIYGEHGCGCSAWVANLIKNAKYDFVKFITPYSFVEMNEGEILRAIAQILRDSFRSKTSLLVFDDLERLIRLTRLGGISFSQYLFTGLLSLLNENPPGGHKLVIVVSSHEDVEFWKKANLMFDKTMNLPLVPMDTCTELGYLAIKDEPIRTLCTELAKAEQET